MESGMKPKVNPKAIILNSATTGLEVKNSGYELPKIYPAIIRG
jgi:hypothetical protein